IDDCSLEAALAIRLIGDTVGAGQWVIASECQQKLCEREGPRIVCTLLHFNPCLAGRGEQEDTASVDRRQRQERSQQARLAGARRSDQDRKAGAIDFLQRFGFFESGKLLRLWIARVCKRRKLLVNEGSPTVLAGMAFAREAPFHPGRD